ncbi:50S ribosomal protein L2 [archaeon]|nr:50S ribosomal protein L2 [archaeon]
MGKRIRAQRRGSGSPKYTAPSHRYRTAAKYKQGQAKGTVVDFTKDPSKSAILMKVQWDDGEKTTYIAPEGIAIDNGIDQGTKNVALGNIMHLIDIPEGVPFFNIEKAPGDGGKMVRSSGASATVVAKQKKQVVIKLPSKKLVPLKQDCRATIGVVAGGGRTDKPLVKAGSRYYKAKAKGQVYPVVRGVAMNAVSHPHGGSQHHTGKASTVKRDTPPGRKVGHIAARRTGRKKRK